MVHYSTIVSTMQYTYKYKQNPTQMAFAQGMGNTRLSCFKARFANDFFALPVGGGGSRGFRFYLYVTWWFQVGTRYMHFLWLTLRWPAIC